MDRFPSSSMPAARIVFLGIVGFVALLVFLSFSPIAIVPAGHVGVMTVFGRVTGQIVKEGINVVNPLAQTHLMTIRTQEIKETTAVPSREGLILGWTRHCFITSIRRRRRICISASARSISR